MKLRLALLLPLSVFVGPLPAQDAQAPFAPPAQITLKTEVIQDIYISPGLPVYLTFSGAKKVESIRIGSTAVANAMFDEKTRTLTIEANAEQGETNLLVQLDGRPYAFIVHVGFDHQSQTLITATTDALGMDGVRRPNINAPAMRPDRIDVVTSMDRIEEAERNPRYLEKHPEMALFGVGRQWVWNNCPVVHHSTAYFADQDLIVLKFYLRNVTNSVLYLHARQYKLSVGNTQIPVTVATQLAKELYPGQVDEVYLFVQGYQLMPTAKFDLSLPPDSNAIRAMAKR